MPAAENKTYRIESRQLLNHLFPIVSCWAIGFVFEHNAFSFTRTYHRLTTIATQRGTQASLPEDPSIRVFVNKRKRGERPRITDAELLIEIDSIPTLNQKQRVPRLAQNPEPPNKPKKKISNPTAAVVSIMKLLDIDVDEEKNDHLVNCKVCCGDYEPSDMHHCGNEDHVVCKTCIPSYVSQELHGNGRLKFKCIGDDGCSCEYSLALLEKVLPEDLNKQVTERTFHGFTEMEGMWKCPAGCGHIGFIEQDFSWIACPNCNRQYCTKCNDGIHDGKTCEEVRREKAQSKNPRHRAHEAMTRACKRFCPHCTQEYIKGDRCNKITCSKCEQKSCYLCSDKIADYSHFCNHKLNGGKVCPCGKLCRLWTSTDEMEKIDRNKRQEAGRKVLAEAGYTDEKEILSILGSPEKIKISTDRPNVVAAARAPAARVPGRLERNQMPGGPNAVYLRHDDVAKGFLFFVTVVMLLSFSFGFLSCSHK